MKPGLIFMLLLSTCGCTHPDPAVLEAAVQRNQALAGEIRDNAQVHQVIASRKKHLQELQVEIDKVKAEIAQLEKK